MSDPLKEQVVKATFDAAERNAVALQQDSGLAWAAIGGVSLWTLVISGAMLAFGWSMPEPVVQSSLIAYVISSIACYLLGRSEAE